MRHVTRPTTKVRALLLRLFTSFGMLLSASCFAMPDAAPAYSISPTTNGLNVAYFVRQDKIKITLYLVNHERAPITCQAIYNSGPDKQHTREQTFNPEKAIAFTFDYGRHANEVHVSFVCEKPAPVTPATEEQPAEK